MSRVARFGIPSMAVLVAVGGWAQSGEEKLPGEAVHQPIPFSHKVHSGIGIECLDCHPVRGEGFQAGFPKEAACLGCHMVVNKKTPGIRELTQYAKQKKPIPWVRVYEVPQYVWFSHEAHFTEAGIGCETCHGPVKERDVLAKEVSTSMEACMACHAKQKAPNGCDFCHDPL